VIQTKTNSHSRTAIREDRRLLPRTTDLHHGTRSTELTKLTESFSTICSFLLPKTLKVSWHWGMDKPFLSCLPGRAYKPANSKPFLLQMCLFLGKFRKCRKTDFTSVISEKKNITTSFYFGANFIAQRYYSSDFITFCVVFLKLLREPHSKDTRTTFCSPFFVIQNGHYV
jgi:hypothetical protein